MIEKNSRVLTVSVSFPFRFLLTTLASDISLIPIMRYSALCYIKCDICPQIHMSQSWFFNTL